VFNHKRHIKFEELWKLAPPGQGKLEYFLFLSFAKAYLAWKGVPKPIVVEIGVRRGRQRAFYKEFLDANYIGIDIRKVEGDDYILGDSGKMETVEALGVRLGGRKIDLLFIDGNHTYEAVKRDWELYSPLTSCIVAIHDILWKELGVKKFWAELCEKKHQVIEFKCPQMENRNKDDGLGVVLL